MMGILGLFQSLPQTLSGDFHALPQGLAFSSMLYPQSSPMDYTRYSLDVQGGAGLPLTWTLIRKICMFGNKAKHWGQLSYCFHILHLKRLGSGGGRAWTCLGTAFLW